MTQRVPDPREIDDGRIERLRRLELLKKTQASDLQWVLSDPRGRRFMKRLFRETKLFDQSFVSGDARLSDLNEGKRSIGIMFVNEIHTLDPELMIAVLREQPGDRTNE